MISIMLHTAYIICSIMLLIIIYFVIKGIRIILYNRFENKVERICDYRIKLYDEGKYIWNHKRKYEK